MFFIQKYLVIFSHLLNKLYSINKHIDNSEVTTIIKNIYTSIENILIIPLNMYFKLAGPRMEDKEYQEIVQGENTIRMKINEYISINKDYIPIMLKLYNTFVEFLDKNCEIDFSLIKIKLQEYNELIFKDIGQQMKTKVNFDSKLFLKDYDSDISNFKYISEFIIKINTLKSISIFAFDESPMFIMKIFKDLFSKFFEDEHAFIVEMKSKCSYNYKFDLLYEEFLKLQERKDVCQVLEFKQYANEKNEVMNTDNLLFLNIIMKFVFDISKEQYDYNNLYVKEYKTMELFTKLISSVENLISVGEGFLFELMKATFSKARVRAYLEQVYFILINNHIFYRLMILISVNMEVSIQMK